MKTILREEISRYIRGELNASDLELFEMKMENDPFLADAVDGYKMFPEAITAKTTSKASLSVAMAISIVGLMWLGLWWLERSLLMEMKLEPVVLVEKAETAVKSIIEISPLKKKEAVPIQMRTLEKLPASRKSIPVLLKAIPRELSEIVKSQTLTPMRPFYRYKATFIHDLKVVSVDTTEDGENNSLPEHLPARWESENQYLGSQEIYMPKGTKKHYMETSLELYQKGQYESCLMQLKRVSERLPGNLNINFYEALCYYHLEDYVSALTHFRNTQRNLNPGFYEEARWYEARCLEKTGNLSNARNIYSEILEQNGFYAMRAASRLALLSKTE